MATRTGNARRSIDELPRSVEARASGYFGAMGAVNEGECFLSADDVAPT